MLSQYNDHDSKNLQCRRPGGKNIHYALHLDVVVIVVEMMQSHITILSATCKAAMARAQMREILDTILTNTRDCIIMYKPQKVNTCSSCEFWQRKENLTN